MDSLQQVPNVTPLAPRLRRQSRVQAAFGVTGLAAASVLLAPKVITLSAGGLEVIGTGLIANLALVFGSLMFLRKAQQLRRQASVDLPSKAL